MARRAALSAAARRHTLHDRAMALSDRAVAGDSNVTVAAFAARHRDFKCDVISIDGLHTSPHVYTTSGTCACSRGRAPCCCSTT